MKNILLNFIVTFLFCYDLWVYISKESNFIYLISLLLATILFQNVLLYAQTEISGKIGRLKVNLKSI